MFAILRAVSSERFFELTRYINGRKVQFYNRSTSNNLHAPTIVSFLGAKMPAVMTFCALGEQNTVTNTQRVNMQYGAGTRERQTRTEDDKM